MRRLYSTFAHGVPGVGLLLLRVVTGGALAVLGVAGLAAGATTYSIALDALAVVAGALLLLGLWTPIVAALAAIDAALLAFSGLANPGFCGLLGVQAAALALLGPGAFSVDARLFGWRRVEIGNGNGNGSGSQKRHESSPF